MHITIYRMLHSHQHTIVTNLIHKEIKDLATSDLFHITKKLNPRHALIQHNFYYSHKQDNKRIITSLLHSLTHSQPNSRNRIRQP